jgi:hypothetical protein
MCIKLPLDEIYAKQEDFQRAQASLNDELTRLSKTFESITFDLSPILTSGAGSIVDGLAKLADYRVANEERHDNILLTLHKLERDVAESAGLSATATRRANEISSSLEKLSGQLTSTDSVTKAADGRILRAESAIDALIKSATELKEECDVRSDEFELKITQALGTISSKLQGGNHGNFTPAVPQKIPDSLLYLVSAIQREVVEAKRQLRQNRAKDNVLVLWHIECIKSAKRDATIRAIRNIIVSKIGFAFRRWKWFTACELCMNEITLLKHEIDRNTALFVSNDTFQHRIEAIEVSQVELTRSIEDFRRISPSIVEPVAQELAELSSRMHEQQNFISHSDKARSGEISKLNSAMENLGVKLIELELDKQRKFKNETDRAHSDRTEHQLQSILTDLLLLWNNLKQIDQTKRDKKDIERIIAHINELQSASNYIEENNREIIEIQEKFKAIDMDINALRLTRTLADELTLKIDSPDQKDFVKYKLPEQQMLSQMFSRPVSSRPSAVDRTRTTESTETLLDHSRKILANASSRSSLREKGAGELKERKLSKLNPSGGWGLNRSLIIRKCS